MIAAVRLAGEEPKYTEAARRGRIEGVVILEVVIETDGSVSGGTVLKPLPFGLTDSAIAAAKTWKYKPGQVRGVAVRTVRNEIVVFKLP
ncbi:MAG: energy transducer TonB [Thermoanaerobaculia bacterium]|nr:energy transducer TonB [Thermoanaerobaculia bacterium]